jgi:hypothetical protein
MTYILPTGSWEYFNSSHKCKIWNTQYSKSGSSNTQGKVEIVFIVISVSITWNWKYPIITRRKWINSVIKVKMVCHILKLRSLNKSNNNSNKNNSNNKITLLRLYCYIFVGTYVNKQVIPNLYAYCVPEVLW